jgi:MYXO-CTERM domain-containing protein
MRVVVVASLFANLAVASAAPQRTRVFEDRVIKTDLPRPAALSISRKLYLNDCKPNGCVVTKTNFGGDSSLTDRSSIPDGPNGGTKTLAAYRWGDAHFAELVQCVRDTFAPFNIEITTDDPGSAAHHEVMIAGTASQLRTNYVAGGVAPFVDCTGTADNGLSFVFASQTNQIPYLCAAVAQEAAHIWGLSHELHADDPMTYLEIGTPKTFQNNIVDCGEELDQPFQCRCDGQGSNNSFQQNSFAFLRDTFGLSSTLGESTLDIMRPTEGQALPPGFAIALSYASPLTINSGTIAIDGQPFEQLEENQKLLSFAAPMNIGPGVHTLTVTVVDEADRTVTKSVMFTQVTSCANGEACSTGTACFGGLCQPLNGDEGGLGSTCTNPADCLTGQCASDGTVSLCSGACEAGNTCPSGFECLTDANLCWPAESGGCNVGGGSGAAFLLIGLAGLIAGRRRNVRA